MDLDQVGIEFFVVGQPLYMRNSPLEWHSVILRNALSTVLMFYLDQKEKLNHQLSIKTKNHLFVDQIFPYPPGKTFSYHGYQHTSVESLSLLLSSIRL